MKNRSRNKHHVPPKHPDKKPVFLNEKTEKHYEAYRLIFGKAKSFEDACKILWNNWWSSRSKVLIKLITEHRAYHCLFHNAKSFEDAVLILKHDWWNRVP